ncbi:MAG: hypothetical protein HZB51_28290 [Chloroflexi bacterium]|nr:hypothetical protein [Chloroflexota bacterium]
MNHFSRSLAIIVSIFPIFALLGCANLPFVSSKTPVPSDTLEYNAPVSLSVKTGTLLPGTSISYSGKSATGAANVLLAGLVAPKQVGDTVDWEGVPAPNVKVRLNTRVATFDDKSVTLVGTGHVQVAGVKVQAGGTPGTATLEFNSPVTYSLKKDEMIPGTLVTYAGSTANGAQFLGLEGYPYRKQLDSLQYVGRLNPKVYLKFDLRLVSFTETGAVVGGTVNIRIEQ